MTVTAYTPGYLIAGKYELESLLGEGGMGAVWRARNVALDAPVAIKVLRAKGDRAQLRSRLMQEARAAAKLAHAAIVKVFDVGQTESGDPFIVMELLQGASLRSVLDKDGRLPPAQVVRLLLPIADALWLAHDKGIVHRDLKPDNVFVVQREDAIQPTLLDFGIVKLDEPQGSGQLTKAGDVLGSPDYMSPEQARGLDNVNHLTDVWSFCVMLYEAVTGRTPFQGTNYNALLRQIVEETPRTLQEQAAADAELSAIVARGLSKQPEARFGSMGELGRALASWLLAQGIGEDICGTSIETKWLRDLDTQGRSGRAALGSFADWPAESGSGVRRNVLLQPVPTPTLLAAPKRKGRARWVMATAAGAVLLGGLSLAAFKNSANSGPSPLAAPARGVAAGRVGPALSPTPPVAAPAASAASPHDAAEPAPVPVSALKPLPEVGAQRARPAAKPPKRGAAAALPKSKAQDLLSPY